MSGKRVQIGAKPTTRPPAPAAADSWVDSRVAPPPAEPTEPMKRLTIDIPESLHRTVKMACAARGTKIADEVRTLLIREFVES